MIAKYNGKCDLTGERIEAGKTEIAKMGPFTVLAQYAAPGGVDAWFNAQIEKAAALLAETASLRGRQFDRSNPVFVEFVDSLNRRRSSKFSVLKADAEFVRNEIAGMERRLEAQRNR